MKLKHALVIAALCAGKTMQTPDEPRLPATVRAGSKMATAKPAQVDCGHLPISDHCYG